MTTQTIEVRSENLDVSVFPGDELRLRFQELRTTGFHWRLVSNLPSHVVAVRDDYQLQGAGVGGGGVHEFIFEVHSGSTAVLRFELARIWEPQAKRAATVSIFIR
jgi:predicted secreted protein